MCYNASVSGKPSSQSRWRGKDKDAFGRYMLASPGRQGSAPIVAMADSPLFDSGFSLRSVTMPGNRERDFAGKVTVVLVGIHNFIREMTAQPYPMIPVGCDRAVFVFRFGKGDE